MSTTSNSIEGMMRNLKTIRELLNKWPTNRELRETHRPSMGHQPPPPPDVLPFGLDKTVDTDTRIKTRFGAQKAITRLANAWCDRIDAGKPVSGMKPLEYLIFTAGRAYTNLEPAEWEWSARYVEWLADTARQVTGYGVEATTKQCPYCSLSALVQYYTDSGLTDEMHCPGCGKTLTLDQYNRYAVLYARYNEVNIALTQSEAALLLGEQIGTINARVKRRGLKPVYGTGRCAKYYLDDLRKKQHN